ncbi:MAG: acyl-CoA synthetase [Chloroflexi bacterium RBG_13_66_10]|nr:MAG: acyl-CoA synthetase [Chloroflexi bacterium RBG_13_66_10]
MSLDSFFRPRSVAVIGASSDPKKLGHAVLDNLVSGGFLTDGRRVFPINPRGGTILGQAAYASVQDVPGPIDLAVIVIPYMQVPEALRKCGEKGIPAAVIISAGFREAGREGLEREQELLSISRLYGIRLIGPNCLGVIDTVTPLNASFSAGMPPGGPMAFMSQSGALGTAILDWAQAGRLGLSKFVSLGNKADVNEIDLLRAWADDDSSRVILCYIEGLPDGQEFMRVARRVAKGKPVVAIKSGITQAGARAVTSHTGSLAGSEQAYQAAFRQAGVVRANSLEDLFDCARAFGYLPPLRGDRIAIVTNAGGPGILATDALERAGLTLARFDPERIRALEQFLPDAASAANPVDLLGDARADRYRFALQQVCADPHVDGVLVILAPQALTEFEETALVVAETMRSTTIPILACFMGEARMQAGTAVLDRHHVPNFPFPERAALVLKAMSTYRTYSAEPLPEISEFPIDRGRVRRTIDSALAEGRVTLGDAEAREIAQACGLATPPAELAATAEEAVEIAARLGYPVVLKIASPDILHKTDVGGVRVGIQNAAEVRDAFDLITYRAQRYLPEARLWGCQVQKMAPPGLEVLIGMNRDPQFGPLVTFGLGGIYVETLKDVSFRIAPFGRREAEEMLGEIRARALIDGVRGKPPADREALVDSLLRVAQLVVDFPEIAELDVNPFIVYDQGQGGLAIDMRLVVRPSDVRGGARAAEPHGSES